MAAYKQEVVIILEGRDISVIFLRILYIFDRVHRAEDIANIARCRPTSDRQLEIKMAAR